MSTPTQIVTSPAGRHSPLIDVFERVPFIAGVAVAIIGALVLAGWALNVSLVTGWSQSGFPMIPLTALCFALAGSALALAVRSHRTATTEAIQQTLGASVATIAVLSLYENIRGGTSKFDLLLFGDKLTGGPVSAPGRIPINTAVCLLLFALALLSIPHDRRRRDLRAQIFAAPGLFIALVAILGYVFDVKGMYSLSHTSGMALPTAIAHLILGVGILVAVRDRGVAALLMDEGAAGVLTRRLLPAALFAPVVLGIVRLAGNRPESTSRNSALPCSPSPPF